MADTPPMDAETKAGVLNPWPLFEVSFNDGRRTVAARSRGAAIYSTFLDLSDIWNLTFREWLGMAKVRRLAGRPAGDPYEYVRRNYDRDLNHGTRVTITGEGRDLEGRAGTVIHPGRDSTAYAHVVLDGDQHSITVHPYSVVIVPPARAAIHSATGGSHG